MFCLRLRKPLSFSLRRYNIFDYTVVTLSPKENYFIFIASSAFKLLLWKHTIYTLRYLPLLF
jgi:hypothetical protein